MGTVRFLLATCVVAFHLTGELPILGQLAVNFFYVISGFLITMAINETYEFRLAPFAANRVLRLFPAYAVCALTAVVLHAVMPSTWSFHASWGGQMLDGDWLGNLFVVPWAWLSDPLVSTPFMTFEHLTNRYRLVPSTWSVAVEMVCYLVVWAYSARSLAATIITGVSALIWLLVFSYVIPDQRMLYWPWTAALFPFSLGALVYHLRNQTIGIRNLHGHRLFIPIWLLGTCAAFCLNWWVDFPSSMSSPSYIINFGIAFLSILLIQNARPVGRLRQVDGLLGDLAYPLFLCHYIAAGWAHSVFLSGTEVRGWHVLAYGLPSSICLSLLIVFAVDRRIVPWRDAVRPQSRHVAIRLQHGGLAPY